MILTLSISLGAKYISPQVFWLPAFFGLAFPFLFIINLLFFIYWFVQFKRIGILVFAILCFSLPDGLRYFQWSFETDSTPHPHFRLTTYNSMLFDLYNWKKNDSSRAEIIDYLKDINSDILCLQEYYTSEEKGDFNNTETITNQLHFKFNHIEFTSTLRGFDHWGIATFSRYPIINMGKIIFKTKNNNACIYSDIVTPIDTIRVYNIHLQSISFSKQDNEFLKQIKEGEEGEDVDEIENSKNVLRRLKRAFVKRAVQVDVIKSHMSSCPYPVIVCGDFNDTPSSYAYHELTENMKDAFITNGNGFGKTYAGQWPQFRIDYILYNEQIKCSQYNRFDETLTDHYPISAVFY